MDGQKSHYMSENFRKCTKMVESQQHGQISAVKPLSINTLALKGGRVSHQGL